MLNNQKKLNCAICKGTDYKIIYHFENWPDLVKCQNCGLTRLESLPPSDPKNRYNQDYFKNYFVNQTVFENLFAKILNKIEKYQKGGKMLEVGFGAGILLDLARSQGWETWGCEISSYAANHLKQNSNHKVFLGEIENLNLPENYFEVVIINHVLEHSPHPDKMLAATLKILKKEGILFLGLPNFSSLFSQILKTKWPGLQKEDHLWQFNRKTISALLEKTGFKIIEVKSETGFTFHAPFLRKMKETLLFFLDKIGRGDALVVLAKK